MTLHKRVVTSTIVLLLVSSVSPAAEPIPGKWQKVDALLAGSRIFISTSYGEILDCLYFSSDRETLLIVEAGGKGQRRIRKSTVEKVIADKYEDPLANGTILGLSAGAGLGVLLSAVSRHARHSEGASDLALGGVIFGLLGLEIGALMDFAHKGRVVLYEAPKKIPPEDKN